MEEHNQNGVKKTTVSNLVWRFAERTGAQGVAFIVSIVLARILDPSEYGLIAIVTVFTSVLQVFVDSGLGTALIQKKDSDDLDFSTVFWFNITICIILYAALFLAAPFIADFYHSNELIPVIRVLGLTLIVSGVKNIQQAYVSKKLIFKKFFYATLGGTIGAGIIGIIMAYRGFGLWALVAQQLFNLTVDTIILWITVKWRPKFIFSFKRLKLLFDFGWKILVANVVNTIYQDIRQLIIGRIYSSENLAYYNRGKQFPNIIVANINTSIDSVLLPVMAKEQDDQIRLRIMTQKAISTSSYLMWPLMLGLAAIGEQVISLLLTEKWLAAYPFLIIFCFVHGFEPIHTANLNAIRALGRSDILLRLEITKKCIGLILILATMNISVFALGFSSVIYTLIAGVLNAYPNKKLLNYSYKEQLRDIIPSFALSLLMGVVVYFLPLGFLPVFVQLLIRIVIGGIIYIGGSKLFKLDPYMFVKKTVKSLLKKG